MTAFKLAVLISCTTLLLSTTDIPEVCWCEDLRALGLGCLGSMGVHLPKYIRREITFRDFVAHIVTGAFAGYLAFLAASSSIGGWKWVFGDRTNHAVRAWTIAWGATGKWGYEKFINRITHSNRFSRQTPPDA